MKEKLISYYGEYISITPLEETNKKTYKAFLQRKFPQEKITLKSDKKNSKNYIKASVSPITYQNFFSGKDFNYSAFINYLVEHTFEPLSHNIMLEIQKGKIASKFVDLFTKYFDEE